MRMRVNVGQYEKTRKRKRAGRNVLKGKNGDKRADPSSNDEQLRCEGA